MREDKILGLRTVIYKVDDLQKAQKWYSNILDKPPYFAESFYVGFNVSGFELGLQPVEGELTKSSNEVAYWGVENIQKFYDRLIKLGADPVEKPQSVGGNIKTATVEDPWGNVFGIIYNPNFKAED
ncbi:VOC family protein [Fodinibius saliphilus]|uniref:VOC family protein n=1 Tax=Fodinibius saliphilus TaxID=1920650 RepID=UPI0011085FF4|nr:VOC family protein [Fodinibius saliphilus]